MSPAVKAYPRLGRRAGVDLEARLRELADAVARGEAAALLADRLRVEVDGRAFSRDQAVAWLAAAPRARPVLGPVATKRNLTFCDGDWPGVGAGVAVLSWDQDGRLAHASLRLRSAAGPA